MKKYLILIMLLVTFSSYSQILDPVKLEVLSLKKEGNNYEVHINVKIDKWWHIFSQKSEQEDGLGPNPTSIVFENNKTVILKGNIKEKGKLIEKFEEVFEVNTKYYENTVVFVQSVQKKTDKPVTLKGTITYMACKDELCLTPLPNEQCPLLRESFRVGWNHVS